MSDLAEFLLAQIAEEEDLARDAASEGNPPRTGWQLWTNKVYTTPGGEVLGPRGTVEAHPARVLAECEAKRRIVELHVRVSWDNGELGCAVCGIDILPPYEGVQVRESVGWPCPTLRLLALPYADHPDYDESWRP